MEDQRFNARLLAISHDLNQAQTPDDLLRAIARETDIASLTYVYDDASTRTAAVLGPQGPVPLEGLAIGDWLMQGAFTQSWLTDPAGPYIIDSVADDPRFDAETRLLFHDGLGVRSCVVIPLRQGDQAVAVAFLAWITPRVFSPVDRRIFETLPSLAAPAAYNLRLLADLEHLVQERTEAIVASEARQQHLLRSSPSVIYTGAVHPPYPTTYVSGNVADIIGYQPEDYLQDDHFVTDRVHADDIDRIMQAAPLLFENGSVVHEYRFRFPDGRYHWLRDAIRLVRDAGGQPHEIVGSWVVIDEEQRALAQLRQRNRHLEALQEIALALGSTHDLDVIMEIVLDHLATLIPYESAGMGLIEDGKVRFVASRGDPRPGYREDVAAALNAAVDWQARLSDKPLILDDIRKDDIWKPVPGDEHIRSFIGVAVVHRGEALGIVGLEHTAVGVYTEEHRSLMHAIVRQLSLAIQNARLVDQLEQRVAERTAELRAERDQSATILNHVADAIVFTNLRGTMLYVNPAWEQVTGYRIEESVGRPLDVAGMEDAWAQVLTGATWQGIVRAIGKSGAEYDAEWIFAPVHNLEGRIHRVVGVLRDVTEARQVEALKARFVADAAHDLRRPLATLRLRTDLLERNPEQAARHLTSIQYQIGRLETLVSDLLTLSELDRQQPDEQMEPVDLVGVVAQVLSAHELVIQEAGLILHVELPPVSASVVGVEDQLVRVVENLLANAINYTPPGGWIRLRLVRQRERVRLTVHDSGIGIPPDALPHIFERFYRADNARVQAEGTGLGMSIVHAIVTMHGGTIEVASTPGEGTRFDVVI